MQSTDITIINKLGLHARAASKFANVANRFSSKIKVTAKEKTIDGKSIMSIMLLAAGIGTKLCIATEGHDEQEALKALTELINDKFGEAE